MSTSELEILERRFPHVEWRTPIPVNDRFACRVCIVRSGLKGTEVSSLPRTPEEVQAHITHEHMEVKPMADTRLRCMTCGAKREVVFVKAVASWPECCGRTMRIVSVSPDVVDTAVAEIVGNAMGYAFERLLGNTSVVVVRGEESPAEAVERFAREWDSGHGE